MKLMPFFSMVDRRKNMHRLIIENPPKSKVNILKSNVPYASEVERMGLVRKPVFMFAPHARSSIAYGDLWQEVKKNEG
jgi:hypothetical protein